MRRHLLRRGRPLPEGLALAASLVLGACADGQGGSGATADCAPGLPPLELVGTVEPGDAKTYRELPFVVGRGTGRIELAYGWTERSAEPPGPFGATTLDLGLWDEDGTGNPDGFRGWSGSRQGRLDRDQPPIFVEAARAERGYVPGEIRPGTWYADLGIAAVSAEGADWLVRVECKRAEGTTPAPDPVEATRGARSGPAWYHGDFHMHAYHSNPEGPDGEAFVAQARAAGLDFLMVTEYVTGQHWRELGALERAHPDLLVWPGREIITYSGHAITHGETPSVLEYRHGFEDVTLGEIQRLAKADGALFQVAHPTIFPGSFFERFCRGCDFELVDAIDWSQVDTIEVLTGPLITEGSDLGVPLPVSFENPFVRTAVELWERKLTQGFRTTAVSGTDSKGVDPPEERARKGYGSSATAVYADELSRPALARAIQAGHAYVRTRGVAASPALELEARTEDGRRAIFGDTLAVRSDEKVVLRTVVAGGTGQTLRYVRNGTLVESVAVTGDPFVHERRVSREPAREGPLGSVWRIETRDAEAVTTIGNPIFLRSP